MFISIQIHCSICRELEKKVDKVDMQHRLDKALNRYKQLLQIMYCINWDAKPYYYGLTLNRIHRCKLNSHTATTNKWDNLLTQVPCKLSVAVLFSPTRKLHTQKWEKLHKIFFTQNVLLIQENFAKIAQIPFYANFIMINNNSVLNTSWPQTH